ncbi:MAG: DNA polymerase I [Lachnospiraceae bacterium]|nr:DNA polymerase I [Lachnospiraceae bacterium]
MAQKLVLIDGHSILNRAFFGLPDLTNSEGLHTNAVYGFLNIMFKILEEEKPQYLTVAFDVHHPTFRHEMFEGYKGTRKPMAEELRQQVPLMKEMLKAMGVKVVELPGYEADDILGTLSRKGEQAGMEVSVISGDRDLLQLATDHVQIRIPKTKKTGTEIENYYAKDVQEKYQVTPTEFIDVKALQGDTSDNIPGVPGIGEKTAQSLIAQYHNIEAVHADAANVKPPRASKNIVEFWDQAVMSKELATIILDAPLEYDFADAKIENNQALYTEEAYKMCKRLEFKNLLSRFETTAAPAEAFQFTVLSEPLIANAHMMNLSGSFSFEIAADSEFELLGLSVATKEHVVYIPANEEYTGEQIANALGQAFNRAKAEDVFKTADVKTALRVLKKYQVDPSNKREQFYDRTICAYLLNPTTGAYPYENIAKDVLGQFLPSKEELIGKKPYAAAAEENPDKFAEVLAYESYVTEQSYEKMMTELSAQNMKNLFTDIEMPLAFVLSDMECEGILMDKDTLQKYGENLSVSIDALEKKIYEAAGEEFNINSPKQLGVILFEKLELPGSKKTKTGYSTSAEVLDKLKGEYPIVADILEYRQLSKLKSTYADGLSNFVKEDGRIHTSYNQTVTATGRLSSTDPNLQNIPIRIELGKQIRKVFYPKPGSIFIDSDYSQIELRVLAHVSGDENMLEDFREGKDIHTSTASKVFHTPFDEVTPLQRRNAKAVNFGIVYGISAFGLSQDLDISRKEAQEYIDSYFETYPKIKAFLDQTVEDAKEKGYITTLFGRIRPIPELSSGNFMTRQFGERVAMNSPIQGTAADIIKIAMIRVHDRLLEEGLKARVLLQVHDELLIEAPEEEKDRVVALLEEEMSHAVELKVDLIVDTKIGKDWYEAH